MCRLIRSLRVSSIHPSRHFCSERPASDSSLSMLGRSSLVIFSFMFRGLPIVSIASRMLFRNFSSFCLLSKMPTVQMSSIYTSDCPIGSRGMFTNKGFALAKGMVGSRRCVFGIIFDIFGDNEFGSQYASFSILFAVSVMVSDIMHHSEGHADPPKVSLRFIRMYLMSSTLTEDKH